MTWKQEDGVLSASELANTIYICNLNAYNDSEPMRNLSKLMESARLSTRVGIHRAVHIFISIIKFIKIV